jgi:hypothetical protein
MVGRSASAGGGTGRSCRATGAGQITAPATLIVLGLGLIGLRKKLEQG